MRNSLCSHTLSLFHCCALEVYRWNHDKAYNDELIDSEIQHVYFKRFEFLSDNLEEIMNEYGRK
jgi:hypothetical protein